MANDPMQQVAGFMPEMQDITRQREMAKLLMQQGQAPLQGQMVGNKYVAPSPWEGIANLFSTYKANKLAKEADTKQAELAELIRKGTAADMLRFNELRYGTPEQTIYGAGQEGPTMNVTPAIAANPTEAYKFALQSRFPQVSGQATEMLKPQKLGEGERIVTFNPRTGKEEVVMQGGEKYHAPIAVDTGTGTVLLDPKTMQPIAKYGKATSGHVLETDNGPVLVDTRTGKSTPIMMNGQPVTSGKPLTEGQGQATGFGIRAAESDKILTDLEKQGVTSTGKFRSGVSGIVGGVPLIGEKLESGTYNAMNMLPGVLGGPSSQQQQTDQARRNFVTAVLRKESGASISPSEFANEEKKYFPQAGDTDAVIKQKQDARKLAIKSLEVQAGSGAKQIKEATADQSDVAKSWLQANPNHPLAGQVRAKLKAEGKL